MLHMRDDAFGRILGDTDLADRRLAGSAPAFTVDCTEDRTDTWTDAHGVQHSQRIPPGRTAGSRSPTTWTGSSRPRPRQEDQRVAGRTAPAPGSPSARPRRRRPPRPEPGRADGQRAVRVRRAAQTVRETTDAVRPRLARRPEPGRRPEVAPARRTVHGLRGRLVGHVHRGPPDRRGDHRRHVDLPVAPRPRAAGVPELHVHSAGRLVHPDGFAYRPGVPAGRASRSSRSPTTKGRPSCTTTATARAGSWVARSSRFRPTSTAASSACPG